MNPRRPRSSVSGCGSGTLVRPVGRKALDRARGAVVQKRHVPPFADEANDNVGHHQDRDPCEDELEVRFHPPCIENLTSQVEPNDSTSSFRPSNLKSWPTS